MPIQSNSRARALSWDLTLIFFGVGVLAVCAPAMAFAGGEDEESEPCKMEVLESGEEACVRTRVISRKVIRRSTRKPQKRSKKKRSRKSRLVVNPSAHERSRESTSGGEPVTPRPRAVETRPASATSTGSALLSVDSQVGVEAGGEARQGASFRIEAVTDVPVLVGAGVLWEGASRLRLRSSVGVMPGGYLRLSNALIRGVDAEYPEEAQLLVERAVDDSITWRSQVGVRPFRRAGFYVHAGYTLLGIRGEATGEELINAAESLDEDQGELMRRMNPTSVAMSSRLHLVDMELGWDFELGRRANLRLGAGWSYTFHSRTQIAADFDDASQMPQGEVALFEEVSGKYLDAIYRRYVHPPSLSVAFGVRF